MEVNIRLASAKAVAKADADEETIVALTKNLEDASKEELATSKKGLDVATMEEEQNLMQEALDAVKRRLDTRITATHLKTELDSEQQSARRDLKAELVLTREGALVTSNKKKLPRGLVALFFFFFWW